MMRSIWSFLILVNVFIGSLQGSERVLRIKKSRLPDFRLAPDPIEIGDRQAFRGLLETGPNTFRANMTYAFSLKEIHLWKFSAEFLSQKLGFAFRSGRSHRWVSQGAFGMACRLPFKWKCLDSIDLSLGYSKAFSRTFPKTLSEEGTTIASRRVAGSDGITGEASGSFYPWIGARLQGNLFYDYVRYRRHFPNTLVVKGLGAGLELEQNVYRFFTFSLGVDVRQPFIFGHAALSSPFFCFGNTGLLSLFGEKVKGQKKAASFSRIGLQIAFTFGPKRNCNCCEAFNITPAASYSINPAVYMPEVLVVRDEGFSPLADQPFVIDLIGTLTPELGPFTFNVTPYFGGSSPLIFGAVDLPSGFQIDPQTGVITGFVDGSLSGAFEVVVFATNGAGQALQQFTLIF